MYDTMHKSLAFHSSFKKIQMRAAKMVPLLSSLMQWASLKSFEARNKAEEQTNSTVAIKLFKGTFLEKSLHLKEAQK